MTTPTRTKTEYPNNSGPVLPWGERAVLSVRYAEGIEYYLAAEGEIFRVNREVVAGMPPPLGGLGTFCGPGWYNARDEWALVAVACPDVFTDDELFRAVEILLGDQRPAYFDGIDTWLESPAAKPVRDRVDAFYQANRAKFRLQSDREAKAGWHCRAATLDWTKAAVFLIPTDPALLPFTFTREELEAAGATGLVITERPTTS